MIVTAIANQKGGVGKTTTAVNLAACLAALEQRTLLIDLDPQANATSAIGMEPIEGLTVYAPLLGQDSIVNHVIPTRFENLFVIPADLDLAGAEIEVARANDHMTRLAAALKPLRADAPFDHILLDCPPSLGILMTNALAAADQLLVPIQCEYFALEGLSKIVRVIEQIRESGANPNLMLGGIVMTMYGRTNLANQVIEEVRKHFEQTVYETVIPRSIRLSEAPSFGKPIIEYEPKGAGAHFYRTLAREFLDKCNSQVSDTAIAD